jgi:hypothetical protein
MTELPRFPKTEEDDGAARERGAPRWVSVGVVSLLVLVVVVMVVLHLTGVVGPGSH